MRKPSLIIHNSFLANVIKMCYSQYKEQKSTDKRYMHYFIETEGGREKMCKAVEEYGKKKKIEGIIEGEIKGKIKTAKNLAAMGMSVSVISQALDVTEASVREWLGIKTA